MRNSICLVAAAALTVAGFSFNVARAADESGAGTSANPTGNTAGSAMDRSSDSATTRPSAVSERDSRDIRHTLAQVTNDALTKDGFAMIGVYLVPNPAVASSGAVVPAGQPRYPEASKSNQPAGGYTGTAMTFKNYDDLNNAVDQLQKDWKEKYGSDFKLTMTNEPVVYNDRFQIVRNDVSDSARQASERMSPDRTGSSTPNANSASNANSSSNSSSSSDLSNRRLSDGRSTAADQNATVFIAQSNNAPAISIDLVRPRGADESWRIQQPASANEQQIHDNLLKQLNTLHDEKANWPADQDDAYRAVSRHVLSIFSDTSATGNSGMNLDHSRNDAGSSGAGSDMNRNDAGAGSGNTLPK